MPRAGFYNDNEYRQYPFVVSTPDTLPTDLIVDCGFIMGLDSGFDAATHCVYLYQVRKTSTQIECEFRTTAANAVNTSIIFKRDFDAEEWTTEFAASDAADTQCSDEPLWEGFMVSGIVTTTGNLLATGNNLTFNANRVVEPGRVQSLVKAYLRSVSVGNYPRIVAPPCVNGVPGVATPSDEIIVNATCLKGDIRFRPGFNCVIRQYDYANRLVIAAQKDANTQDDAAAELCEYGSEIKLYSTEQPPIINTDTGGRSKFLSGGPACDEVITGINGLGAPNVKIVGGAGIQVVADTDNPHTIQLKIAQNLLTENC